MQYEYLFSFTEIFFARLLYVVNNIIFWISKNFDLFKVLQCWEYANKYKVLDENKEQIFLLKEESDCLARYCCNNIRPLEGSFQVQCKQTHILKRKSKKNNSFFSEYEWARNFEI